MSNEACKSVIFLLQVSTLKMFFWSLSDVDYVGWNQDSAFRTDDAVLLLLLSLVFIGYFFNNLRYLQINLATYLKTFFFKKKKNTTQLSGETI